VTSPFTDMTDLVVALGDKVLELEGEVAELRRRLGLSGASPLRACRAAESGAGARRSPLLAALDDAVAGDSEAFELVDLLGYPPSTWHRETIRRGMLWRSTEVDGVRRYWVVRKAAAA
jgi:hypothetical protein